VTGGDIELVTSKAITAAASIHSCSLPTYTSNKNIYALYACIAEE